MAHNDLCGLYYGGDDDGICGTYTAEGITALCDGLKGSAITSLRCAVTPLVFASMSAPVDTAPVFAASRLGSNGIGGHYDDDGEFISNTDGVMALCEGLKGSSVTSLECAAAAPKRSLLCQRPLTPRLPSSQSAQQLTW